MSAMMRVRLGTNNGS
ncbi:hypothetical protein MTR67_043011 [Solanum verrucosum]|uniref:Uncharacterized protein n=1 Tax=Solanum verrucosum TaxID=315347 RepID=A0AAF0UQI7_SOLVR|nr:hypothetical protein MTR67_043011 [Solanum verrucosum]